MFRFRSLWLGLLGLVLLMLACNALSPHIQPTTTAIATSTTMPHFTAIPTLTPTRAPQLGDTWTRPADGMVMMYVPAGEFVMGSTDEQMRYVIDWCISEGFSETGCQRYTEEQPSHIVALDAFWIDQTEVTNAQYQTCVDAGVCRLSVCAERPNYNNADQPVTCVDWEQANQYAMWVGGRLPTEAEWEYVARGPEGRIYPWGNEFEGTRLNYCDKNCIRDRADKMVDDGYKWIAPVGSFPEGASWVGALDMAGNVWEWTGDWYGEYSGERQENPTGPVSGNLCVMRGGSLDNSARNVRSAGRFSAEPTNFAGSIGFRCVVVGQGQ